jgi:head-tail adaptor
LSETTGYRPVSSDAAQPPIGRLRWPVTIARRVDTAAGTSSIAESLQDVTTVHAEIQPIGTMTYLGGQQTDSPITHRVTIRWLDWVDETFVLVRRTLRLDLTVRTEVFRIRRLMELAGRKRFLAMDVELESRF